MGSPGVVARVLAQQSFGVAIIPDEQVIEAIASKRADDALTIGIGSRSSRRREELLNAKPGDTISKRHAVDAVAIMQKEAWLRAVVDCFDKALGCPFGRWMRGDADVHDLAPIEREDHEAVEHLEAETDDGEEVAGPDLREVIVHERRPPLAAAAVEGEWSIFGDGTRRNGPAELAALGGNRWFDPRSSFRTRAGE
jgi:hypothetical protein